MPSQIHPECALLISKAFLNPIKLTKLTLALTIVGLL
jgi:hypothetical protein